MAVSWSAAPARSLAASLVVAALTALRTGRSRSRRAATSVFELAVGTVAAGEVHAEHRISTRTVAQERGRSPPDAGSTTRLAGRQISRSCRDATLPNGADRMPRRAAPPT